MKLLFNILFQAYLISSILSFSGCVQPEGPPQNKQVISNISVTDFRGKELNFEKPVERVVCLIESGLTGIYMLNAEEKVVGISSNIYSEDILKYYSALDPRIKNKSLPCPGNWDFVNLEQIISLRPGLVIIWASQNEAIKNIENFGIPVYGIMLHNFEDVLKEISDFGILFGKKNRSDSLILFTKNNLAELEKSIKTNNQKSVYFAWMQGITETSGQESIVNDLIKSAGGRNVVTNSDEHVVVNLEKIVEWNPGAIVLWKNGMLSPEDVIQMDELQQTEAVKNASIFEFPSAFECDLWTLKFQYAALLLNSWLYPINADSVLLSKKQKQIFQYLYNTDFNFSDE